MQEVVGQHKGWEHPVSQPALPAEQTPSFPAPQFRGNSLVALEVETLSVSYCWYYSRTMWDFSTVTGRRRNGTKRRRRRQEEGKTCGWQLPILQLSSQLRPVGELVHLSVVDSSNGGE